MGAPDSSHESVSPRMSAKARASCLLGNISCVLLVVISLTTLVVMMSNTSRDDPPALDVLISLWPWVVTSIPAIVLGFWSLCESRSASSTSGQARKAVRGVGTGMAGLFFASLMLAGLEHVRVATQLMHIG
jgi:hypothetical protein